MKQLPRTIANVLRFRVGSTPDAVAYRFLDEARGERCVTYAELDERARAIAAVLARSGKPGERALLCHSQGLEYVSALFGCFYAGVIAVPAYSPRRGHLLGRLNAMVQDARPRWVLSEAEAIERGRALLPSAAAHSAAWLATDLIERAEADAFGARPVPCELALLQYTSGSTSLPKGVMISHANFLHNAGAIAQSTQLTSQDCMVSWLPLHHDMGLMTGVILPLSCGFPSVLMAPLTFFQRPSRWLEAISTYRATLSGGPNFGFDLCAKRTSQESLQGIDLSSWRRAFVGAERVRARSLAHFAEVFAEHGFSAKAFTPCYGLAEATLAVSCASPDTSSVARLWQGSNQTDRNQHIPADLVTSGAVVPGLAVAIVDPVTRAPLEAGQVGEVWVQGPSVALGYWEKPELSAEVFGARTEPDVGSAFLRTGDLGFQSEGELYLTGRLKDLIIVGGVNHYPDDIEIAVADCHPQLGGIGAAFSIDTDQREQLVLVHELVSRKNVACEEIAHALRDAVASALSLPVFEVVLVPPGTIPRTSSGKVQRALCKQRHAEGALHALATIRSANASSDSASAFSADTLRVVQSTLAELLGVANVGVEDDLFLLGGHSLLATQLVSRLRESLGKDLSLRDVFDAPNAAALATRIEHLEALQALPPVASVSGRERLPLSFSQERMWFLQQLEPEGTAYNVAGALSIEGVLDVAALERALRELLQRHEALRTRYPSSDGEPHAVIDAQIDFALTTTDLTDRHDALEAARARATELASTPFDVANELLFRAQLMRIASQRHLLAVSLHHLVTDGWSMGVIARELVQLYEAFRKGSAPPEPARVTRFVDYAAWQRRMFAEGRFEAQLAYWKEQLAHAPPLELPFDRPRAAQPSSAGGREPLIIEPVLLEKLRCVGAANGATLFMVLLAGFEILLHRYSGQTDLVVGVPVANRHHLVGEGLVGSLVNTLPLRMRLVPSVSLRELLAQTRALCLDALAHQDFPFERLISELAVERHAGQSPLLQVMFDYQSAPTAAEQTETLRLSTVDISRSAAQFELSLLISDGALGKTAVAEYRRDLFEPDTVRRFLCHYVRVLESFAENLELRVDQLELLDAAEQRAVIALGRAAPVVPRELLPVHLLVERWAERSPEALALVDATTELSYAELSRRVLGLAEELRAHGVGPGQRVAIYLERSQQLVVSLLAVMHTGAAYVPLDPLFPAARIALVLEDCDAALLITERPLLSTLPSELTQRCLLLDAPRSTPGTLASAARATASCDPGAPAYVLYTSGSTGKPKGVEVSVGALENFLHSMAQTPGLQPGAKLLAITTVAFDIAGLELFLPLYCGATVHVVNAEVVADGVALSALVASLRPALLQATPATWNMLLEAGWSGHTGLTILCGGEALSRELADRLLALTDRVWNVYGPTETTIWSTLHRVEKGSAPVPVGRPLERTSLYVLDARGALCPIGVSGELCIGGAGVANGYFGRPDLTRERFVTDTFSDEPGARMYRTGDRARLDAQGVLHFFGRLDHQIKIRGYRVEPGEIEHVLKQETGATAAVVVAREERPGDMRLIAYYVPVDAEASAPELRERLARRLPAYMLPAAIIPLAALPQTPNGKIDRAALPRPTQVEDSARYVAPRTATERAVAEIWQSILGLSRVSVEESFFQIGGHSLLAVRIFARIERELGARLPLSSFLATPTIAGLASRIDEARLSGKRRTTFSHLVQVQGGGSEPALFCVHGAGGNVLNFAPIAERMGRKRPFFGLVARGIDGRRAPSTSVPEMAAAYLAEIRKAQARGPYDLAGYCGGGLVAFEMARSLLDAGEEVRKLVLIDSYHPQVQFPGKRLSDFLAGVSREGPAYVLEGAKRSWQRTQRQKQLEALWLYHRARHQPVPLELRDPWLTAAFFKAARHYQPRHYPGKLILLYATSGPLLPYVGPELGWHGLAQCGIETLPIPGDHDSLAREPHVGQLAATLLRCLA